MAVITSLVDNLHDREDPSPHGSELVVVYKVSSSLLSFNLSPTPNSRQPLAYIHPHINRQSVSLYQSIRHISSDESKNKLVQ